MPSYKPITKHHGVQLQVAQLYSNQIKGWITIDVLLVENITVWNADVSIMLEWLVHNIESIIVLIKMTKNSLILSKEPNSSNVLSATIGFKGIKDVVLWNVNVDNNFAILVEELPVLMDLATILAGRSDCVRTYRIIYYQRISFITIIWYISWSLRSSCWDTILQAFCSSTWEEMARSRLNQ